MVLKYSAVCVIKWTLTLFNTVCTVASHAGVLKGARISSLPTNPCSTKNNIPFPRLANYVVLSKFWKVDLDYRVTPYLRHLHRLWETFMTSNKC